MELGPSKWAQRFLSWFIREDLQDAVEGDLYELFIRREKKMGRFRANLLYVFNVLSFCQPFAWRRLESIHWMLWFRMKIFSRSIKQERFITLVKTGGLAIGLFVFLLVYLFYEKHNQFDQFIKNRDDKYRVNLIGTFKEIDGAELGTSHFRMGPLIKSYPEIKSVVRVFESQSGYLKSTEKKAFFDRAIFSEAHFFEFFSFPLIYGSLPSILERPNGIVISEKLSKQLFGDRNPIGSNVDIRYGSWIVNPNGEESTAYITGVFRKVEESHLDFDVVTSFSTPNTLDSVKWSGPVVSTYVELEENVNEGALQVKLKDFFSINYKELENMYQPVLQPLNEIHLGSSGISSDPLNNQKFDRGYIYIFLILAVIILLLSATNYVQLTMGVSYRRSRLSAIGQLLGGKRIDRWAQSGLETACLMLFALLLAVGMLEVFKLWIEKEWNFSWTFSQFLNPTVIILFVTLFIILVIAPLLQKRPVNVLQYIVHADVASTNWLSKTLIGFQLALGFGLIAASIVVYRQTSFMLDQNAPFSKPYVLQVQMSEDAKRNYSQIKDDLGKQTRVQSVTAGSNSFGEIGGLDLKVKIDGEEKILILPTLMVDSDYLEFYDINVMQGNDFTEAKGEFIINETMAKQFGWDDPIGQTIGFAYGKPGKVIGVVKDFNYNTMHRKVEAFCFWNTSYYRVISIEINPLHISETLTKISKIWEQHVSDAPFSYTFLDDDMRRQYEVEMITNKLVRYLTLIAIALAVSGVYSLTYLMSKSRLHEASIKKILGASSIHLLTSFSLPVFGLLSTAIFIAAPVCYFLLTSWLEGFAYRVSWPMKDLIFGCIGLVLIVTLAMGYNIVRLSRVNPVDTLRE